MKKLFTVLAIALFTISIQAQETKPTDKKEKDKKECSKKTSKDKKSCCVKK